VYEEKSDILKLNTILNYMKSDVGRPIKDGGCKIYWHV
jgi:hypothetical protein